jgi:DNA-binding MarR family transcriptional regulator
MSQISLSEFADKMSEVIPLISKDFLRQQSSEFYKVKVTLPQIIILNFLHTQGETKMSDMARTMEVTTAAMTGIVDRLVRESYVTRIYDPSDRRIIKIRLTSKGKILVERINQQRQQMIIKIFGKISAVERQDYLRILMHIRDILVREEET